MLNSLRRENLTSVGIVFLCSILALPGCAGENSNAESGTSSPAGMKATAKLTGSGGDSCIADFAKRTCELLTEPLIRTAIPAAPATLKQHEMKSAFASCSYNWPSERRMTMEVMGRSVTVNEDNQISLSMIKTFEKDSEAQFRRSYLPTAEEQQQAKEMLDKHFDKQLEKTSADLGMKTPNKKTARSLVDGFVGASEFTAVEGLGTMASWEIGNKNPGGNLYVLDGDTKFQISTNISAEPAEDRELAVKLAHAVLKSCQ